MQEGLLEAAGAALRSILTPGLLGALGLLLLVALAPRRGRKRRSAAARTSAPDASGSLPEPPIEGELRELHDLVAALRDEVAALRESLAAEPRGPGPGSSALDVDLAWLGLERAHLDEPDRLRAAWRAAARRTHPDSPGGDPDTFRRVQEAWSRVSAAAGLER